MRSYRPYRSFSITSNELVPRLHVHEEICSANSQATFDFIAETQETNGPSVEKRNIRQTVEEGKKKVKNER